jgi:hypothetical protein
MRLKNKIVLITGSTPVLEAIRFDALPKASGYSWT